MGTPIPPVVFTPNPPKGLYWPAFDQIISFDERLRRQVPWGSSYYAPIEDISTVTLEYLGERLTVQDLPENRFNALNIEPWKKIPTLEKFDPAELAGISSFESATRSYETLCKLDPSVHRESLHRALDLGDMSAQRGGTSPVWPECKLILVWCDMSVIDCVLAASSIAKLLDEEGSRIKRRVEMARLAGSNHFVSICFEYNIMMFTNSDY